MLVTASVDCFDRPVHVEGPLLRRRCIEGERPVPVGGQHRHLAVIERDDARGVTDDGTHVGTDEHLPLTDADDDRRAVPSNHDAVGLGGVDDDEPVGPLDLGERCSDRLLDRDTRRSSASDQMGEAFRVGLTEEGDAVGFELGPELGSVLDDPVVNDRNVAGCVEMGMGVRIVRLAVGRPSRVTDAEGPGHGLGQRAFKLTELALFLDDLEALRSIDDDTGGVVAAVLDPGESLHENR